MKQFLLVIFVSVHARAAGAPTTCQVGVTDLKTGAYSALGNFEAELGEEQLTTKTFQLTNPKRLITARVYFTDEWVGIKWPDDKAIHDLSTTVRIDVEKKAKKGDVAATGEGTQTRVLFSDWNNLKAIDVCNKALSDKQYAASIAAGGNLPILLDSCQAYVENSESNTLVVTKTLKGKEIRLICTDNN
jgi:hypothetical protein